jgi:hypothetical protein
MKALILSAAIVLGSPSSDAGAGSTREPVSLPVYAFQSQLANPGCTPILYKDSGGHVWFMGCPTYTCGANDECETDTSDSDEIASCRCQNGGAAAVLCQGIVILVDGEVGGYSCVTRQCGVAVPGNCVRNDPPVGVGTFNACDCL